ncbi:MAG: hypothetical protein ACRDOK_14250 [Streptosporangiaceae bacterium]
MTDRVVRPGGSELPVQRGDLVSELLVVLAELADALVRERNAVTQRGVGCGTTCGAAG